MDFPKNDKEIRLFGLLLKICKLESIEDSPYNPENEQRMRMIEKLKNEYFIMLKGLI